MGNIDFRRFTAARTDDLADLLAGNAWPFHAGPRVSRADVVARVATGYYDNESARTFCVVRDGVLVGMTRLFDLDDDTPMFDLRVAERFRGAGVGSATVRWLTAHLFTELPSIRRIEGSTRQDNHAMRRLFQRCGYVKEAHYRQAWPAADGTVFDAVGYGILRGDWETGTVTAVVDPVAP